jgi:heat shock protein HslJ
MIALSLLTIFLFMPQSSPASSLEGSRWLLEDLGGKGVLDRAQATLEFTTPGRVSGRGSCNRISGPVSIEGSKIRFGPLVSTRMACAPATNEQEANYLKALGSARRFEKKGDSLLIYCKGLPKPLRFTPLTEKAQ